MIETEVVIIGAGPAGLAAAAELVSSGAKTILIDEYLRLGGQFFKQVPASYELKDLATQGKDYARGQELIRLVSEAKTEMWLDSLIWGTFPDLTLAVRRGQETFALRANKVIISVGAFERPVPFPGWTLPGVITAGAAQTLVKSQGILPGRQVLMVGAGPFQLPVAHQLIQGGAKIRAVVEGSRLGKIMRTPFAFWRHFDKLREGLAYWWDIRHSGTEFIFGHTIVEAKGRDQVESVDIAAIDKEWRIKRGSERLLEVDLVCLAFGFLPSTRITQLFGCCEVFDEPRGGFLPAHDKYMETSVPGVFVAGECAGIGGSEVAMAEGKLAALAVARQLGLLNEAKFQARLKAISPCLDRARRFADYVTRSFTPKSTLCGSIPDNTIVCRCEEITAGEIRRAVSNGARSLKAIKIMTRAGMGLCQGRICASSIAQLASQVSGLPAKTFGELVIRPPIKPVPLKDIAAAQYP